MNHPLNTILYGPPGTGKTYATFRRCVEICDGPASDIDSASIRSRYDQLVDEKRIEFVTFHQAYGYEEFVEGLRPEAAGEGGGLRLIPRDGVLKAIAARAENTPLEEVGKRRFFKVSLERPGLFKECLRDGWVGHYWPENEDWSDPRYDSSGAVKNRIREGKLGSLKNFAPIATVTFRSKMKRGDLVVVPVSGRTEHSWASGEKRRYWAVGEVVGNYEFHAGKHFPHRRAVRWHWVSTDNPQPVKDFQDRQFTTHTLQQLRPNRPNALIKHLKQDPQRLPYVLVIDEINRANIAKVMGELITLLEDDKRAGAENEIAVTLPHSGDRFTLPGNLHVLGTMNTADRSIALLDTALRRRFTFEEIAPDPTLLTEAGEQAGIDLPAVLRTMNDRLEWLVDRDHRIGHAWFLGAKSRQDVDEVMRRKVIPLIAEYFYDDWEKVRAVLGGTDAFITREKLETPPGLDVAGETRFRWTVRPSFAEDAYAQLLAGKKS